MENIDLITIRKELMRTLCKQKPDATVADFNNLLKRLETREKAKENPIPAFQQLVSDIKLDKESTKLEELISAVESPPDEFIKSVESVTASINNDADSRVIVLRVGSNDVGFDQYLSVLTSFSFVYYNLLEAMRNKKITPAEWIHTLDILYRADVPNPNMVKFISNIGQHVTAANKVLEDLEKTRQTVVTSGQFATELGKLGLDKPIEQFNKSSVIASKDDVGRMLDAYGRFANLPDEGSLVRVAISKYVMQRYGILPNMQTGYAVLGTCHKDKSKAICEDINKAIAEDLGNDPMLNRYWLTVLKPAEFDVMHLVPSEEFVDPGTNPMVTKMLNNMKNQPVMDPVKEREALKNLKSTSHARSAK